MKTNTINQFPINKILLGVYLLLFGLLGLSVFFIARDSKSTMTRFGNIADNSYRKLSLINKIQENAGNAQIEVVRSLSIGDENSYEELLRKVIQFRSRNDKNWADFRKLSETNEELAMVNKAISNRLAMREETNKLFRLWVFNKNLPERHQQGALQEIAFENYQNTIVALSDLVIRKANQQNTSLESLVQFITRRIIILIIITSIMLTLLGVVIIRAIKKINRTNKELRESEGKFRTLFQQAGDTIVMYDPVFNISDINDAALNLLNYTKDELVGMNILDIIDEQEHSDFAIRKIILDKDGASMHERKVKRKNGSFADTEVNIRLLKGTGYISVMRDITGRKVSEEKLRVSEERYKSIITFSNTGAWEYHLDTNRVWQSTQYFAMLGLDRPDGAWDETLNSTWINRLHPDDRERATEYFADYLKGGASGLYENYFRLRHENGEWIWMWSRAKRLLDKNGNPTQVILGTHIDITERKHAEAQLKSINHDIGERVKELNCLYHVSELTNTPGKTIKDILAELVHIIPLSYQYPEITTARIIFKGRKFENRNFSESNWKQQAPIKINNVNVGLVEVFYTREMPLLDEGPFLKEERSLINSIAEILGSAAERKNAEALIKEQAEVFKAIIENTKESIYLISPEFKVLQFNDTARERERITRGMNIFIGADFRDFVYPEKRDIFLSQFEDALKGIYRMEEVKAKSITGHNIWFQSKTSPVYDPGGKLIGVRVLTDDINDRKRAEAILRESEEKFRTLVEQSLAGVYILQDEKFVYTNPAFEKISGYRNDELIGRMSFEDLVHEEDIEKIRERYSSKTSGEEATSNYIIKAIRANGELQHLEIIISTIIYKKKMAIIGTVVDITARIEEEMRIENAIIDAQEKERLQIGMELHDNIQQMLAASSLYLEILGQNINNQNIAIEIITNLKTYISEAVNETRRLSHQLAPSIDIDTSLSNKIGWLVNDMNVSGDIEVIIDIDHFDNTLPKNIQLTFYRIIQEQLNNILKYAEASQVVITIKGKDGYIILKILDDGKGFDTTGKKEGIGLENIRRRTNLLNGKVEIKSAPGDGCRVIIHIPFIQS
ncbi:MAG: PAS domain S-box protein [Chitinophagaceae bacterium]